MPLPITEGRPLREVLLCVGALLGWGYVALAGAQELKGPTNIASWYAAAQEKVEEEKERPLLPEKRRRPIGREAYEQVIASGEYLVGPGDKFVILAEGELNASYEAEVLPEGQLFIPDVGMVHIAGMKLRDAQQAILSKFEQLFRKVKISVALAELREFEVAVLGEVQHPGTYTVTAVDMVSEVIKEAGGLIRGGYRGLEGAGQAVTGSSLRNIRIRREGRSIVRVDLLRYAIAGDTRYNPYVRDGDAIVIPVQKAFMSVLGAVNAPGDYEFVEGERVSDLIELARGVAEGADLERVELVRYNEDGVSTRVLPLHLTNVQPGEERDVLLQKGDQLFVRFIPKWHLRKRVMVQGEVVYPGEYAIDEEKDTLTDLIQKAGGFTEEASLVEAEVMRQVSAEFKDPEFERLKEIEVPDMTEDEYEYFKMKSRERPGKLVVDFVRLFRQGDPSEDVLLRSNDIIRIPRIRQTVTVSGQVANPGAVLYNPSVGVREYIAKAGGYGWNANKRKTRVIKGKTGEWLKVKEVRQLEPGDTIWVPEKPDRDWWNLFTETMGVIGEIATVYLLLSTLAK